MYFHSLHSFFSMGGYGDFVWSAYAIVFGVLGGVVFNGKRKKNGNK